MLVRARCGRAPILLVASKRGKKHDCGSKMLAPPCFVLRSQIAGRFKTLAPCSRPIMSAGCIMKWFSSRRTATLGCKLNYHG